MKSIQIFLLPSQMGSCCHYIGYLGDHCLQKCLFHNWNVVITLTVTNVGHQVHDRWE